MKLIKYICKNDCPPTYANDARLKFCGYCESVYISPDDELFVELVSAPIPDPLEEDGD